MKLESIRCPRCCGSSWVCGLLQRLYTVRQPRVQEVCSGEGDAYYVESYWRAARLLYHKSSWNDGRSGWQNPHFLLRRRNASIRCYMQAGRPWDLLWILFLMSEETGYTGLVWDLVLVMVLNFMDLILVLLLVLTKQFLVLSLIIQETATYYSFFGLPVWSVSLHNLGVGISETGLGCGLRCHRLELTVGLEKAMLECKSDYVYVGNCLPVCSI